MQDAATHINDAKVMKSIWEMRLSLKNSQCCNIGNFVLGESRGEGRLIWLYFLIWHTVISLSRNARNGTLIIFCCRYKDMCIKDAQTDKSGQFSSSS